MESEIVLPIGIAFTPDELTAIDREVATRNMALPAKKVSRSSLVRDAVNAFLADKPVAVLDTRKHTPNRKEE